MAEPVGGDAGGWREPLADRPLSLVAVCTGKSSKIEVRDGRSLPTGIRKSPRHGSVGIGELGVEGDQVDYRAGDGGASRAVCVMGGADIDYWAEELGCGFEPGAFGENLCVDGLDTKDVNVGDRIIIGEVVLEATEPRVPCSKLTAHLGYGKEFIRRYMDSGHTGFFCKVPRPGEVAAGAKVRLERQDGSDVTIVSLLKKYQ